MCLGGGTRFELWRFIHFDYIYHHYQLFCLELNSNFYSTHRTPPPSIFRGVKLIIKLFSSPFGLIPHVKDDSKKSPWFRAAALNPVLEGSLFLSSADSSNLKSIL